MTRHMHFAGSFYPESAQTIKTMFERFKGALGESHAVKSARVRAIVVPHAGYVYSGASANVAYEVFCRSGCKRIVVIGPSHRVGFQGSSVCAFSHYQTPFGSISGDEALVKMLQEEFSFLCVPQAHAEHSTEVQFPFLKHYCGDIRLIEIVYSQEFPSKLAQVIQKLLEDSSVGIVISTDLSHFYDLETAQKLDSVCIEAFRRLEADILRQGCEACGKIGLEAMLIAARTLRLRPILLDYRTSADASGDTRRVVGYFSGAFAMDA